MIAQSEAMAITCPQAGVPSVVREDHSHPVIANLPPWFAVDQQEWYSCGMSPRSNARVLARIDELTYSPDTHDDGW